MEPELRHLAAGAGRKLLLLGDVRTVKVTGADTGGALTVVEQVVEPGAGAALHRHAYQELFYLLEGALEFTGENGSIAAAAGATVVAASGAAHGYRNTGLARARFLAVMQPAGADGFFEEVGTWLDDERAAADAVTPSPDEVRAAAARHGIEFL